MYQPDKDFAEAFKSMGRRRRIPIALTQSAAEDDVARLTAVYEHMKPQQAAELFTQMDVQFAAGFFARLRPDFAGSVMAALDPVTAYAISAVLAGRNANTPRD